MLREIVYPKIESILKRIADYLNKLHINPNHLTFGGLSLSILGGTLFAYGQFRLAGVLVLAGGFCDMLDGVVARTKNKTTKFGAFIDSVTDRYSDFIILSGLLIYYAREHRLGMEILLLIVILRNR